MGGIEEIRTRLRTLADSEKAEFFPRFFKAGPGEYAEGDKFLGVTVPNVRSVVKWHAGLPLTDIEILLKSEWHEERLTGVLILVAQYAKADEARQKAIYEFYMSHTERINNWDLVDCSAEFIIGPYLADKPEKLAVLQKLAASRSLWERRIAMLATFDYIKQGRADDALLVARQLLNDRQDLIQKAVGWMLREVGKRVDTVHLTGFLDENAAAMPRTMLRYAIEHLTPEQREYYLGMKRTGA